MIQFSIFQFPKFQFWSKKSYFSIPWQNWLLYFRLKRLLNDVQYYFNCGFLYKLHIWKIIFPSDMAWNFLKPFRSDFSNLNISRTVCSYFICRVRLTYPCFFVEFLSKKADCCYFKTYYRWTL